MANLLAYMCMYFGIRLTDRHSEILNRCVYLGQLTAAH